MAEHQSVVIVPITRRNVFSPPSRRNAILQKGKFLKLRYSALTLSSAKYIEGLENRLGRMEQLLKMSGLLTDEEANKSDLGAIEKRLAEKTRSQSIQSGSPKPGTEPLTTLNTADPQIQTPQNVTSPRDSVASPSSGSGKASETENLTDMMCSLVTNGNGETRYIGRSIFRCRTPTDQSRIIISFLHILF